MHAFIFDADIFSLKVYLIFLMSKVSLRSSFDRHAQPQLCSDIKHARKEISSSSPFVVGSTLKRYIPVCHTLTTYDHFQASPLEKSVSVPLWVFLITAG